MIFLDTIPSLTLPVAVGGLISLILSISEPKQAHVKLAREQALLRCLIDAVSDLIFIKERDSVYRGCNKASEDTIGLPECEQIGKTDFVFFERKRAEQVRKIDRRVLEQGKAAAHRGVGDLPRRPPPTDGVNSTFMLPAAIYEI